MHGDTKFGSPDDLNTAHLGWLECTAFPSEIHVELMRAGMIADPYRGWNEHQVQCWCHLMRTAVEITSKLRLNPRDW